MVFSIHLAAYASEVVNINKPMVDFWFDTKADSCLLCYICITLTEASTPTSPIRRIYFILHIPWLPEHQFTVSVYGRWSCMHAKKEDLLYALVHSLFLKCHKFPVNFGSKRECTACHVNNHYYVEKVHSAHLQSDCCQSEVLLLLFHTNTDKRLGAHVSVQTPLTPLFASV